MRQDYNDKLIPKEKHNLCKELLYVIVPITCSCVIFSLWFIHEAISNNELNYNYTIL